MVITGNTFNSEAFLSHAATLAQGLSQASQTRHYAIWSAAIATGDTEIQERVLDLSHSCSISGDALYEVVLQSYLFLGFPRMLTAAESWSKRYKSSSTASALAPVTADESSLWFTNGMSLSKRVYGESFVPLKDKVESMAPEIFRWMIVEGYGKVLSRPGLSIIDRELCIVSSLMVENREQQLYSHIRGALNVGAHLAQVETVINDIASGTPDGAATAHRILAKLRKS
jgi:alkylhydroperoxidase/carboxymuconolactone decarboxylase family protein YurZ